MNEPSLQASDPNSSAPLPKKPSPMSFVFSLAPLVLFYVLDSAFGTEVGLLGAMVYSLGELLYTRRRDGKWNRMTLVTSGLVLGLGGLSLLSDDERFMLYTPVIGDLLFAGILLGTVLRGRPLLLVLSEQQMPDMVSDPIRRAFMKGLTWRLGLNLIAHASITAWSTTQSHECWLFVSGPVQYILFGAQLLGETAYGRLVVMKKLDRWEEEQSREKGEQASRGAEDC